MKYQSRIVKDKLGRDLVIRNAELEDAEALIKYLQVTAAESKNLIREPEEIKVTLEMEEGFIQKFIDEEGILMLVAMVDGEHAGNCTLLDMGPHLRYKHRCGLAIALYKEFQGAGIANILMESIIEVAKEVGYEQMELEVVSDNTAAIALYEKYGFKKYGVLPHRMKYSDGSYADADWMMKELTCKRG